MIATAKPTDEAIALLGRGAYLVHALMHSRPEAEELLVDWQEEVMAYLDAATVPQKPNVTWQPVGPGGSLVRQ